MQLFHSLTSLSRPDDDDDDATTTTSYAAPCSVDVVASTKVKTHHTEEERKKERPMRLQRAISALFWAKRKNKENSQLESPQLLLVRSFAYVIFFFALPFVSVTTCTRSTNRSAARSSEYISFYAKKSVHIKASTRPPSSSERVNRPLELYFSLVCRFHAGVRNFNHNNDGIKWTDFSGSWNEFH